MANGRAVESRPLVSSYDNEADKGTLNPRLIIPAATSIYLPIAGDFFYFPALSDLIYCAPVCRYGKQVENPYFAGTGLRLDRVNAFKGLQLRNANATDTLFVDLVAGFDSYIDNRLTYPNAQFKQVIVQTYGNNYPPNAQATSVTVEDMSGTTITDSNGNQYYAVNRQLLLVFNADAAEYQHVTNTAKTQYLGFAQPITSLQLPISGDVKVIQGLVGSLVNAVVSEIYNCLPKLI